MALFTDGPVATIEDLTAHDSQLPDVASVEGIDVTRKLSLAQEEIGLDLSAMLSRLAIRDQPFWASPRPGLPNIVATPALKRWHALRTLELIYGDAYHAQLNDRYAARRDEFKEAAKRARERLAEIGVGITLAPVPQAVTPTVTATPGPALGAGTYYVTMAWVNTRGDEGASAAPAVIETSTGTLLVQPGAAPAGAAGWNVYAGPSPDAMVAQNGAPLALGAWWIQPAPVATAGRGAGTGQAPEFVKPLPRVIPRG
jgi:hypothetical protein